MPRRRADVTRAWVLDLVRSGLGTEQEIRAQVLEAVRVDLRSSEPEALADAWISAARDTWAEQAAGWPEVTDHDRLEVAFGSLEDAGIVVLRGCADHWDARDALIGRCPGPRGIVWFTAPDVWHAIGEGMLEVNLWHPDTANAAAGDDLVTEVLGHFGAAGLRARFDEGRIEVAARWQRRPPV